MDTPSPQRPLWKVIFLSPDEPRLRAGWRLLLQTLLLIFFMFCVGIPFALLALGGLPFDTAADDWLMFANQVAETFAVGVSVFLARRFLDRRSFVSLGLHFDLRALLDLVAGILITFVMMGLIALLEWRVGWLTVEGFAWETESLPAVLLSTAFILLTFVLVGWNEELLSRGYHLQTIASGTNRTLGVVLSSGIFGALHLANPHASWMSTLGIFLAGLFLAYGYLRTGRLWLSIGLHIGWNFFEGVVFGFPVSGMEFYRLMRVAVRGPDLWTGGYFGPEAGLVLLPALALGALLIYGYTRLAAKWSSPEE